MEVPPGEIIFDIELFLQQSEKVNIKPFDIVPV